MREETRNQSATVWLNIWIDLRHGGSEDKDRLGVDTALYLRCFEKPPQMCHDDVVSTLGVRMRGKHSICSSLCRKTSFCNETGRCVGAIRRTTKFLHSRQGSHNERVSLRIPQTRLARSLDEGEARGHQDQLGCYIRIHQNSRKRGELRYFEVQTVSDAISPQVWILNRFWYMRE